MRASACADNASLLRLMGLEAICPRPRLSPNNPEHTIDPYLLRQVMIERVNQVWSTDITCVPLAQGWAYLAAVLDWHSRYVLSWELSNTLEARFCCEALERALQQGRPEIFNTGQGSQFTSREFTARLRAASVRISMDGRGRCLDNVVVERLWRSVKYEDLYIEGYEGMPDARSGLSTYFAFSSTMTSVYTPGAGLPHAPERVSHLNPSWGGPRPRQAHQVSLSRTDVGLDNWEHLIHRLLTNGRPENSRLFYSFGV